MSGRGLRVGDLQASLGGTERLERSAADLASSSLLELHGMPGQHLAVLRDGVACFETTFGLNGRYSFNVSTMLPTLEVEDRINFSLIVAGEQYDFLSITGSPVVEHCDIGPVHGKGHVLAISGMVAFDRAVDRAFVVAKPFGSPGSPKRRFPAKVVGVHGLWTARLLKAGTPFSCVLKLEATTGALGSTGLWQRDVGQTFDNRTANNTDAYLAMKGDAELFT